MSSHVLARDSHSISRVTTSSQIGKECLLSHTFFAWFWCRLALTLAITSRCSTLPSQSQSLTRIISWWTDHLDHNVTKLTLCHLDFCFSWVSIISRNRHIHVFSPSHSDDMQVVTYCKIQLCSCIHIPDLTRWIFTSPPLVCQSEMLGPQHILLLSLHVLAHD